MSSLLAPVIILFFYIQCIQGQNFVFSCLNQTVYCVTSGTGNCQSCPFLRPFCDSTRGECVDTQPITQDNCPSRRDGAVPTLDSCNSYVQCLGGAGHRVLCPLGSVFNPATASCGRGTPCYRFLCGIINEGRNIPYPGDPTFYAFCSGRRAIALQSCDPGLQYVSGSGCQIFCPGIGNFTDYSNCQGYYLCILTSRGTLQPIPVSCPANQIFSPERGQCVNSNSADATRVQCSEDPTVT